MKLYEAVAAARIYLGEESAPPDVAEEDTLTRRLVDCANLALAEIAAEYAPLTARSKVVATDGGFEISALPKRATKIKKVFKDGAEVAFRQRARRCETNADGSLEAEYEYLPPRAELNDECDLDAAVGAKTLALGALAEYCAIQGMFEQSEGFAERFREDMRTVVRRSREIRLPKRRWE